LDKINNPNKKHAPDFIGDVQRCSLNFATLTSGRLIALREHMELCLQALDESSVKTGNCLNAVSFAG
jgi:hypothetical protein